MFPSSAGKGFHIGRKSNIVEDALPIEWIGEIGKRLIAGIVGMFFRRQDHGFRNRYTDLCGQTIVEKFFVCTPPEWIVDDSGTGECGIFQIGTVKRNVLRNAVDDYIITGWLALLDFVVPNRFRNN